MDPYKNQFNWLDLPDKRRVRAEAMQFQFSQTQKLPPAQLAELQFGHLQKLVHHAVRNVPYYRDNGYADIRDWQDWQRLPVLNRDVVQSRGELLQSENDLRDREGRSYKKSSSGSTGRPIEVLVTDRGNIFWRAITVRDHLWHKRDFSQTLAVIKHLGKDRVGPPGKRSGSWGESSGMLYATGPCVMISSANPIDEQYRWLQELRPGYLLTYPSLLRALAERNREADKPLQFMGLSTIGETLTPETRHFAEAAFGARVSDMYSCQEIGYLALQCPVHDHYHVQAETCLVEVLDEQDQPCAPGEMGKVVATHLHNHVMPLIRYAVGDYAIRGDTSDCGIKLPVLERIVGRTRNLVRYPDGRRNWPEYNMMKLIELLPNAQFQLVQKSLDSMLLRIGSDQTVGQEILETMRELINTRMGYTFNIDFEQVDTIPRSASGKYEDFVSEVDMA